jgi:subtilisin family serine protease
VINMSVAGPPNKVLLKVIGQAARRGMVLLAAAGNNGPKAPPAYPAAAESVLAVTAVDRHRQIYRKANRGAYIDFAAPGVSLWTAVPGGGRFQSGTSFAVPFVAALAALALADGDTGPARLGRRLAEGVRDLGTPGRDEVFGRGLVRAAAVCPLLSE